MIKLIVLLLVTIVSIVHGQTDYCKLSCNDEMNIVCKRKDVVSIMFAIFLFNIEPSNKYLIF